MRQFKNSSVYKQSNKSTINANSIGSKIQTLLANKAEGTVFLNGLLQENMKELLRQKNSPIIAKIADAVKNLDMLLFITSAEYNLPACIPFFHFEKDGIRKSAVNLTMYVTPVMNAENEVYRYDISPRILEAILTAAYIDLRLGWEDSILPQETQYNLAVLWAKMFNKVLQRSIALSTNKDKFTAFMYYAIIFFTRYYLLMPMSVAESFGKKYLKGLDKNPFILFMETNMENAGYNLETMDFTGFCTMLFDNSVTNTKDMKINNISESMNVTFYYRKFIDMYYYPALMSLGSVPYFIYTLLSAYNQTEMVSKRSLEEIVKDRMFLNTLTSLYNEVR